MITTGYELRWTTHLHDLVRGRQLFGQLWQVFFHVLGDDEATAKGYALSHGQVVEDTIEQHLGEDQLVAT